MFGMGLIMNQKKLLKKLRKDLVEIERKQKYSGYYKVKYRVLSALLRAGVFVEFGVPFIMSGMLSFFLFPSNNKPFVVDNVKVNAKRVVMDDSFGYHQDIIGFNLDNNNELKYSEAWFINDYGLYERNVTSYDVDDVDLNDKNVIFDMNKDDLDSKFSIKSVEKIQQIVLKNSDFFYEEPVISIISVSDFPVWSIHGKEDARRNFFVTASYLLITVSFGSVICVFKQDYVKRYLERKLEDLKIRNEYLDMDSSVNFDKIRAIMEDNLELVKEKKLVR